MIFKITTTSVRHSTEEKRKYSDLRFLYLGSFVGDCSGAMIWEVDGSCFGEVDIKDLAELMSFVRKYGRIVLSDEGIEIYDECRE